MLFFASSNSEKLSIANHYMKACGVEFTPLRIEIPEIQSLSTIVIAEDKAQKAFATIQEPVFVSDHAWRIEALKGFPGPFIKYVNHWLTAEDIIRLMMGISNRRVFRQEVISYMDKDTQKTFVDEIEGTVLERPLGSGLPFMQVVSIGQSDKSMAQCIGENRPLEGADKIWNSFCNWLLANKGIE